MACRCASETGACGIALLAQPAAKAARSVVPAQIVTRLWARCIVALPADGIGAPYPALLGTTRGHVWHRESVVSSHRDLADGLGARHLLPGRNVQPLGVKLLVERQVVCGEPCQCTGVLNGARVHALVTSEAGAGTDVRVPPGGPPPLGALTGLPGKRPSDEREPARRAVRGPCRFWSRYEVVGVDDHRGVPPGVAN